MKVKHNFLDLMYAKIGQRFPDLCLRVTRSDIDNIYNVGIETLKEMIKSGDPIRFHGFGIFELYASKRRVGRNPQTGETIPIPPRKKVKFRTSKAFADEVIDL